MPTQFPHAMPRMLTVLGLSAVLVMGNLPASTAASTPAGITTAVQVQANKKTVTKVKTTANLNMRTGAGTGHKVVLTIRKGKTLSVSATASNGWYKVGYSGKTGWVSNKYVTVVASSTPKKTVTKKPAPKNATKTVTLWVKATSTVNVRKGSSTSNAVVTKLAKGKTAKATSQAANGWYRVTVGGKTGWVSNTYVTTCSKGCEVDTGKYTSNRAGLTDRYFTRSNGADIYASVGGQRRISDIPKNSIVYRDAKWEKDAGQVSGWYFVRTQGISGWMKSSDLKRSSNAGTKNTKGYTRAQVLKQKNGQISSSMLVAIPWDTEKTLIAAPALADLTRLNTAFKKKFGKNLDIDLAYRTLDTQKYYYRDLGPFIAAKPGTSNHGWGLAIDVPETYDYSFRGKYYKWLKANAHKYNWVHRAYLEEYRANGTRNPYAEAWHFEYVGK
ncbi:SH3 domain-containing protein [Glutamicibacter sp. MNS18]|uniref:SH3 domain-containing protein n=1 Tax=Glutamicibacter sp. MNS18 TaxID=2989817 RepID=UPI00223571BA|nr:SH3 domain-containing protein [Glutamicibacter sp. MNS18]MCW4465440.1 SH3 domain-containing protein [Glutamicibacter sp. MNS18]